MGKIKLDILSLTQSPQHGTKLKFPQFILSWKLLDER